MTKVTDPPPGAVHLGHGVYYTQVYNTAGDTWVGIHEWHRDKDDEWCAGYVAFDIPNAEHHPSNSRWTVESYEPLSLSPSLYCQACDHHGWIRGGCWEPA